MFTQAEATSRARPVSVATIPSRIAISSPSGRASPNVVLTPSGSPRTLAVGRAQAGFQDLDDFLASEDEDDDQDDSEEENGSSDNSSSSEGEEGGEDDATASEDEPK